MIFEIGSIQFLISFFSFKFLLLIRQLLLYFLHTRITMQNPYDFLHYVRLLNLRRKESKQSLDKHVTNSPLWEPIETVQSIRLEIKFPFLQSYQAYVRRKCAANLIRIASVPDVCALEYFFFFFPVK